MIAPTKISLIGYSAILVALLTSPSQATDLFTIYSNHNVQTNLNVMRQHNLESTSKNTNEDKDLSSHSSEKNYEESAKNDVAACDKGDHFIAPPLIWYAIKGC